MKILALEFSSPHRSVAVLSADAARHVLASAEASDAAPGNTMKPLGLVERALQAAGLEREQIECVAVGLGPGSYTGIRAAIALAQGWSLGREVRLRGISSALAVAAQAHADGMRGRVNVVLDAQRGEFYLAGYELDENEAREVEPLRIVPPEVVRQANQPLLGPEVIKWFPQGKLVFPRAGCLAKLALDRSDFLPGEQLEPIYLRETMFVKAPPPRAVPAN